MKTYKIAQVPGDGVGPEVVEAAWEVLGAVAKEIGDIRFDCIKYLAGRYAYNKTGMLICGQT